MKVAVQLMRMPTVPRPGGSETNVACRPGVLPYVLSGPLVLVVVGVAIVVLLPMGTASAWAERSARTTQLQKRSISWVISSGRSSR